MRKTASSLLVALTILLRAGTALAEGSWTGWITDSHCGAKGARADHVECAKKCAAKGASFVLYNKADQKIYGLDRQDLAKQNLGYVVVVTGTASGMHIRVSKITPAAAEMGKRGGE